MTDGPNLIALRNLTCFVGNELERLYISLLERVEFVWVLFPDCAAVEYLKVLYLFNVAVGLAVIASSLIFPW